MFEYFENYITSKVAFSKDELQLLRSLSTTRKLRKRQFLLNEGEVCRYKAFVTKGLLRTYNVKGDGTEHIMRFSPENGWTLDPESFHGQTPTKYNIEALEDTELVLWTRENFTEMCAAIPALKLYSERLISSAIDAGQNRVLMHISFTAEEKYQEFISSFPDVFARVPLHMVASYLGVSRETLSRIRHAQLKR